jgi:hypothetical protein
MSRNRVNSNIFLYSDVNGYIISNKKSTSYETDSKIVYTSKSETEYINYKNPSYDNNRCITKYNNSDIISEPSFHTPNRPSTYTYIKPITVHNKQKPHSCSPYFKQDYKDYNYEQHKLQKSNCDPISYNPKGADKGFFSTSWTYGCDACNTTPYFHNSQNKYINSIRSKKSLNSKR